MLPGYASGSQCFYFRLRSRQFRNLKPANDAARHAGHHGLTSLLKERLLSGAVLVSNCLMASVVLSARGTFPPRAADRLRCRRIEELKRPWWPARRAAASARLRSLNRRRFGPNKKTGPNTQTG